MDYKKMYEEAFERARKLGTREMPIDPTHSIQEQIFPELRESEDEKIKKAIVEALSRQAYSEHILNDWEVSYEDAISWLEKQKPVEWSEEDEVMLYRAIDAMQYYLADAISNESKEVEKLVKEEINWLKSLKPQPHWRPSREQLGALNYAYCEIFASGKDTPCLHILQNLIDELKTLCDYE